MQVKHALVVAPGRDFVQPFAQDRRFAGADVCAVIDIAATQQVAVVRHEVEAYTSRHGESRPSIRSAISMPAIVPWVRPLPESPVATKTLRARPGLRPMNASESIGSMICPDQR